MNRTLLLYRVCKQKGDIEQGLLSFNQFNNEVCSIVLLKQSPDQVKFLCIRLQYEYGLYLVQMNGIYLRSVIQSSLLKLKTYSFCLFEYQFLQEGVSERNLLIWRLLFLNQHEFINIQKAQRKLKIINKNKQLLLFQTLVHLTFI
ncbi:unnamed protein product [Paramecium pentaurelia]|uniref:Uncharacterized protein n=1 Tax=Paramecium pentaurelia TaxID=43138 RepID=A0A8S1TEZ1_9CILI|nr:unnamed protein product [Paramecium pentaurelia]